jgi:hypothetical protein
VGVGAGDWTTWDSPAGQYLTNVAQAAASVGAVPMFTLYQIDGNAAMITSQSTMTTYWSHVKLMYQLIAAYGKPVLVNLEPDLWGFVESGGAGQLAYVKMNADCSSLPNTVAAMAQCLIKMARQYAPNAYVGFPPAGWSGGFTNDIGFMSAIGAQNADFIVVQVLDRDIGCYEASAEGQSPSTSYCRASTGNYWDETNAKTPNFTQAFTDISNYRNGIGNSLPIIWWQIPMGVPSSTPGGTPYHYRDNREDYFLKHAAQMAAFGTLAVVFSTGENHQTNMTTDGGQFQSLDSAYFAAPAELP